MTKLNPTTQRIVELLARKQVASKMTRDWDPEDHGDGWLFNLIIVGIIVIVFKILT